MRDNTDDDWDGGEGDDNWEEYIDWDEPWTDEEEDEDE